MYSIVISAFPGMGKTYLSKKSTKLTIVDHESTNYKFINSAEGRILNPSFPNNYIDKLKEIGSGKDAPDIIFVSSHSEVRDALHKEGILYYLIAPYIRCKDPIIKRYRERGNSEKFCKQLDDNWFKYLDSINNETWPFIIKFNENQFITDELLTTLLEESKNILEETNKVIKNYDITNPEKLFWSSISRSKSFSISDLYTYKEYIDWDILCKFNKVPIEVFKNKGLYEYINWRYLNQNIKKYPVLYRKLISKNSNIL